MRRLVFLLGLVLTPAALTRAPGVAAPAGPPLRRPRAPAFPVGNRAAPGNLAADRRAFGDDWYAFWAGGARCLVLNASLIYDPSGAAEDARAQDDWLTHTLAAARADHPAHLFVFQHHPWFLER